jgi:probable addiction module antidote protein
MTVKTRPFDAANYLQSPQDIADYLDAVIEDALEHDDTSLIAAALGDVARAKGMRDVAEQAGLSRESLYRALGPDGNPTLATLQGVLRTLGLRLAVVPADLG